MKNIKGIVCLVAKRMSYAKKLDIVLAVLFMSIIEFRLGVYLYMCFVSIHMDIMARWVVGVLVTIAMVAAFVFFGAGTLFESQGEQKGTTRKDYLEVMKYCTGCSAGILVPMSIIYIANIDIMTILGYTSLPCMVVLFALYLIYRIKYNEEVDAYDR